MDRRVLEFPPPAPEVQDQAGNALSMEQVIAELAPNIQTEADLQHLLSHTDPDKREAIEKCLRANGACASPENPAC